MIAHRTSCCGVADLDRLGIHRDPADALRTLKTEWKYGPFGHVAFAMFTGVVEVRGAHGMFHNRTFNTENYGKNFATFLTKENLGTVTEVEPQINPASGNVLGAWLWTIDRPALTRWFEENA